jgi:hypothetical protein
MKILSHRGYWRAEEEKNTPVAFRRSFEHGFGLETDIRDFEGELVLSHDMANKDSMKLEKFFKGYSGFRRDLPLALNIKTDGLQKRLKELLKKFGVSNYFVFDMSVPDALAYLKEGLITFTRQSEYEPVPAFYDEAKGVWIDCFASMWFDEETIKGHLRKCKNVCLVSPELHGREHLPFWNDILRMDIVRGDSLMLCTDHPEEAGRFFNEKN